MPEHPINILAHRYPQLSLPVEEGMKSSELYRAAVLCGEETGLVPIFSCNERDSLDSADTPAGKVEILFLTARADFEHAVQALAYRCEPQRVPPSMGATTISGLINWEKIRSHMRFYEAAGGEDPDEEFHTFTSDKKNYLDTIIILSAGDYSAVKAETAGYEMEEWKRLSIAIRKHHELTHFVSGRLFPENRNAVRDEIVADMIGITAALGSYDATLGRLFLGIEGESYREGGRLQNYVASEELEAATDYSRKLIRELAAFADANNSGDVFSLLELVEANKIGL